MTDHDGGTGNKQPPLPPQPSTPPSSARPADAAQAPHQQQWLEQSQQRFANGPHLPAAASPNSEGEAPTAQYPAAPYSGGRNPSGRNPSGQYQGGQYQGGGYPSDRYQRENPSADQGRPAQFPAGQAPTGYFPPGPPPANPPSSGRYDQSDHGKPNGRRRRYGAGVVIGGMAIAALLGGGVAAGTSALLDGGSASSVSAAPPDQGSVIVNNTDSVNAITAAAQKASPSVVTISVAGQTGAGTGSGIILDKDGHILTNTHVVTLGGKVSDPKVEVRTSDGKVYEAKVIGIDPESDLAVIQIKADNLVPATLGDSNKLNVGDAAVAIGAPLGLSGTVTDGIISTLNRTIQVASSAAPSSTDGQSQDQGQKNPFFKFAPPDGSSGQSDNSNGSIYLNVIQTDAAINHGNSGGALVNAKGEIVGVNVAIASESSDSGSIGVGFAIPMDYAKRIAAEIIEDGSASHAFLGVSVTGKAAQVSNGNTQFSVGAEVAQVVSGSPADKAGLKKGDVIVGVGDLGIDDAQALTAAVKEQAKGSSVKVTYLRDGKTQSQDVTLGDAASQNG